jgi:hypothetical protein
LHLKRYTRLWGKSSQPYSQSSNFRSCYFSCRLRTHRHFSHQSYHLANPRKNMSAATPTPQDSGLPAPPTAIPSKLSQPSPSTTSDASKPTILHLGDDIRWNHELYAQLQTKFNIIRTYSMGREEFKSALKEKRWGDFVGMYRPFWNTGGEMGNWDDELMYFLPHTPLHPHLPSQTPIY